MAERPVLTIDPAVQGGAVCVPGTRIPAFTIGSLVFAGDDVDFVVDGYEITREQVLLCCWYWGDSHQWGRTKWQRELRSLWGAWIEQAHQHFARPSAAVALDDPPKTADASSLASGDARSVTCPDRASSPDERNTR